MSAIVGAMARAGTAFADPTLTMLHQRDAQVTTAIFAACFPREVRTVPVDRMHGLVEEMLGELRATEFAEKVPDKSSKELCASWRQRQWLVRDVDDGGGEFYSLTSAAQSAQGTVNGLTRERTSLSGHRISNIVQAVRTLNADAHPSRPARIEALEREKAEIEARLAVLHSDEPLPAVSPDYMLNGFMEILTLIADLPRDFQRVRESFVSQRSALLTKFRSAGSTAGELVGDYLDQADHLMDTAPGRAFQGALELLRDQDMLERLSQDLKGLLEHPTAEDILNDDDRAELSGIARTLTSGISTVITHRRQVTAVLQQNIQTHNTENDHHLENVLRDLEASFAPWLERTGSRTRVDLELLPLRPQVKHLRERLYDPADDLALKPMARSQSSAPEPMTLAQLRALGGPDMPALRAHLEGLWRTAPGATLASAFAQLPDPSRRPADLLGAVQVATDSALVGRVDAFEHVETLRPDGARRTWEVPTFAVGAPKASPGPSSKLNDLLEDLEDEMKRESE